MLEPGWRCFVSASRWWCPGNSASDTSSRSRRSCSSVGSPSAIIWRKITFNYKQTNIYWTSIFSMLIWPGRIFSVSPSQIFSRILKYRGEHESKVKGIISFRTFINALIIFTNISVEFFAFVCFSGRSCWVFFLNFFLKIDNCNLKLHRLYSDK